jgi:hypothetical protein
VTHQVLQGADHALSDPASQQAYTDTLVDWLAERMFGSALGAEVVRANVRATADDDEEGRAPETMDSAVVAGVAPA